MARAKKAKKELTPEEKLAQALVPAEEQPYEVPENWCWVRLGSIAHVKGGKRIPKGKKLIEEETSYPYIRVTDFDNRSIKTENVKYIDSETYESIKRYTISVDDIYISIAGTIGKVGIIPACLNNANLTENAAKITEIKNVNQKFLLWYLESETAQLQMKNATISTTQPKLAIFRIEDICLSLPPLKEQQRIVDRIESMFAKLDEAKEKAQEVVDGFELRKSAILHKAFTGELTAKWREENGVTLDSWEDTTVGDITNLITKGASPRWQGIEYTDDNSQTLFVTSENVREGYLDLSKEKYLDNKINDIQKRSVLKYGDVLLNIVGASIGRAAIFNLNQMANTNQAVSIVRFKEAAYNKYFCLFFNSPMAQSYYYDNKVETARANISLSTISNMEILLPTYEEQQVIVKILDDLLEKEQHAKELAENVIAQIDIMKKAVLARAFRGELGTNDPADEPAMELLRRI